MFILTLISLILVSCLFVGSYADAADRNSAIHVSVGSSESAVAALVQNELRTYFSRMFTQPVTFVNSGESPDLVIGTPSSNPVIRDAVSAGKIDLPDGTNADQGYTIKTVGTTIYIAGNTDQGILYGVYELLERYGAYFQISGERLPAKTAFKPKKLDIRISPTFKYRGLLPWDNFLDGMSGYNLEHYQELIDRATRMKMNMLQFHFYPGMAFFTESWNGKPVDPTCIGMPVDVFRTKDSVGESAFKGEKIFAPKPYVDHIGNPRAQAEAVQSMMRKVIDYAHVHGMKTCVGFELMRPVGADFTLTDKPDPSGNIINPLDPHNVDLSIERFRTLVQTYPNSDFYWMWQSECQGWVSNDVGRELGAAEMRRTYAHWSDPGAAGDVDYAYLFREVANRLTPAERARLGTGGWSIEHIFPRIDVDFPKEVIFASLNSYNPIDVQNVQISSYSAAKSGRPVWMIEWWEFDGNAWFPQFRVTWQESMYKRCVEYGVESVTLLGWKLSATEHNIRYLSEFCWDPTLDAKTFYKNYVQRLYGPAASSLVKLFLDYDKFEPFTPGATPADARTMLLGPGWQSLPVPSFPGTVQGLDDTAWKQIVELASGDMCGIKGQCKLYDMDMEAIKQIRSALPKLDKTGRSWANLMLNRLQFRQLYLKSMIALNEAILAYDKVGREGGITKAREAASSSAKVALSLSKQAIEMYARDIRNRSDQGLIAQLNEQYYGIIKQTVGSLGAAESEYATIDWTTFRINPTISFDFSENSPWQYRDGNIDMSVSNVDGKPTLRLKIGGEGVQFNSVSIAMNVDVEKSPFMDFRIRTTSTEPVGFMFQTEQQTSQWYTLNINGAQSMYTYADRIPGEPLCDGKWHRVTWNISKLFAEQFASQTPKIRQIILGSWECPKEPIVIEFQDFTFGQRNTLN